MKHLLYITILLFSLTVSGQRYYRVLNGEIVQTGLPATFVRVDGTTVYGYKNLSESVWYADGWRNEVRPAINNTLQRYGARYYDIGNDVVTYEVIDKTTEELASEKESLLQSIDENFDVAQIKKLLIILTKSILNSDSVKADELTAISTIYPQWRTGKAYAIGDVCVYDSTLYKVIQAHTSQSDWTPPTVPALYNKYIPYQPNVIPAWTYPVAYKIGYKVTYNGKTYSCLQAHTSQSGWNPVAVPSLWHLVQ